MRIKSEPTAIKHYEELYCQECRANVTGGEAKTLLWPAPFKAKAGASAGELIAQMQNCGPDNPHLTMRETRKELIAGFKSATAHLDTAQDKSRQLWLAGAWLKSGVPPDEPLGEPLSSYVRTLLDGGKAGLCDPSSIAKELVSLSEQADARIAEIRRSGRKYLSAANVMLTKAKAAYLKDFPAWAVAVPALEAKAALLTKLHRQQFPTHRKTPVQRRGSASASRVVLKGRAS